MCIEYENFFTLVSKETFFMQTFYLDGWVLEKNENFIHKIHLIKTRLIFKTEPWFHVKQVTTEIYQFLLKCWSLPKPKTKLLN